MATKRDLQNYVNELNKKYCKNTKNELVIHQAYGGYSVELTGKTYKHGNRTYWRKGSIGSGCASVGNDYHDTATNTLNALYKADSRGWVKSTIRNHENRKRY